MENLKDKNVLVLDYEHHIEFALKLAESFGKVYYFTNWQDSEPSSVKSQIGRGLEKFGVYKVDYFWDYVDEVDLICFFDTYSQDVIEYLRNKGYRVFGAGRGELLETNRKYGRQVQEAAGLPTQPTNTVMGLKALGEALKSSPDSFVKLNTFRGDIETFYARDYASSKVYLDKLAVMLGPRQESVEFMVEKKVDGIEPGYDGFVIDGVYSNMCMWGYEKKESGYIGMVVDNKDLPPVIKDINDKLADFFAGMKTRSVFSTELIVNDKGEGYLIDPTVRCPMPVGTALHLEMWDNLAEFIWEAAVGNIIDLKPRYRFGCGTTLGSNFAEKDWLEVSVDEEVRPYVKFQQMMMSPDGKYYSVPGYIDVCAVIGCGNTVQEAIDHLKSNIERVKGFQLDCGTGGIDNIMAEIKEGAEYGLPDFTYSGSRQQNFSRGNWGHRGRPGKVGGSSRDSGGVGGSSTTPLPANGDSNDDKTTEGVEIDIKTNSKQNSETIFTSPKFTNTQDSYVQRIGDKEPELLPEDHLAFALYKGFEPISKSPSEATTEARQYLIQDGYTLATHYGNTVGIESQSEKALRNTAAYFGGF